jgi:ABC-type dipeptide/oligopeptide/nickel transport system ATPase component
MGRKLPDLKHNVATLPVLESNYISRVPFIFAAIGPTASGKTHLALSIIKLLRREHTITKLYVICPSFKSNMIYKAVVKDTDWVFEDVSKVFQALKEIELDCAAISEQYRNDLLYQIAYKRYTSGETITSAQEHLLENYGYRDVTPVRPSPCLVSEHKFSSIKACDNLIF